MRLATSSLISGWSFRKLSSNGCKLSMVPSAIAPDSTLFPPSLAVIPPKIPWSKVLLESFLDQPFSLAMSPIFSAPSLANSLASACRSCTFLNVKGHNNGLRMILVLHSAVYFLFCMMGISCLCSIMLQIYAKKSQGAGQDLWVHY